MPRININEVDNTIYSTNQLTNDNIVYVPGYTPTGEYRNPVLLTTTNDFESQFGDYPLEGYPTYNYVRGLLVAGLPVLFRRIVGRNMDADDSAQIQILTKSANGTFLAAESGANLFKVEEKWGGSFGNNLTAAIIKSSDSYYFRVYYNGKIKEEKFIAQKAADADEDQTTVFNNACYNFFKNTEFDMVNVTIDSAMDEDPTGFAIQEQTIVLTGGADPAYPEEEVENAGKDPIKDEIPNTYDFIKDKYLYDVKFVTAGGYTDSDVSDTLISSAQVKLCETRKDCFAILDIPFGTRMADVTKFFTAHDTSYAAAYAPWCYTKLPTGDKEWMAPSYLFLYTLGRSIKDGNMVYDAPAGVLKASMPQVIKPEYEIGGDVLNSWTSANPQSINPIMKLQSYGYVIYGQNTLYNIQNKASSKKSALQKINVRLAINEVRRLLFNAGIRMTFQANTIRTWNEFKAIVEPELSIMKANNGIHDYRVKMDNTTTTDEDIQNNTIRAQVSISVTKAVEDFEIDFYIEPQSVTFADEENSKNVLLGSLYV